MDLNPLAEYVCGVIEEKGFHTIEHSQLETLTFGSCCIYSPSGGRCITTMCKCSFPATTSVF